ncbi:glycosyltransferase 87 family protein [Cryptosporangium aurantiacum]|uniref:Alpha-1,2-mannosyltransferase n=1 Tax=Cryptosporangium aurantiacum TaxID=134849 RepID=A0A1M7R8U8_9ACTN|nr:glycosyltransferase 87 family protein [Cryptosporangium aurantiacum]SHN42529.1 alpha-1,2-mannosyltransferase [Cryptosporangium aurantiacum]
MSKLRVAFGVQLLVVVVFTLLWNPLDFSIYRLGGQVVGDGTRLYLEQQAAHWFTYTPFAAVTFVPLSAVPLVLARTLWALASVAAFVVACRGVLALAGYRRVLAVVVVGGLLLEPVWHSLFLGQINLMLCALVVTDLRRGASGRWAGIGIGIAAAIKLTPGIFIVLLLAAGRVRAAMIAGATFAGGTLLGFLVAPDASLVYWRDIFYDTTRVGVPYVSNQSPYGALVRLPGEVGGWYVLVPLVLGAVGIGVAAVYARRGDWLAALATTGLTGLLVSPISWSHHWVWALPALVVLVRDGYRRAALAAVVVFATSPMWATRLVDRPGEPWLAVPFTVVQNAYLLLGLALLAHLTLCLQKRSGTVETAPERVLA